MLVKGHCVTVFIYTEEVNLVLWDPCKFPQVSFTIKVTENGPWISSPFCFIMFSLFLEDCGSGHSLTTVRYSQVGKDSELPQILATCCLNAPAIRIMSLLRAQLEILVLLWKHRQTGPPMFYHSIRIYTYK